MTHRLYRIFQDAQRRARFVSQGLIGVALRGSCPKTRAFSQHSIIPCPSLNFVPRSSSIATAGRLVTNVRLAKSVAGKLAAPSQPGSSSLWAWSMLMRFWCEAQRRHSWIARRYIWSGRRVFGETPYESDIPPGAQSLIQSSLGTVYARPRDGVAVSAISLTIISLKTSPSFIYLPPLLQ